MTASAEMASLPTPEVCPTCGGSGTQEIRDVTGKVAHTRLCPTCSGSGKVEPKPTEPSTLPQTQTINPPFTAATATATASEPADTATSQLPDNSKPPKASQ